MRYLSLFLLRRLSKVGKDWYQDIVDFHREVMQDDFPTKPYVPEPKYSNLRFALVKEEMEETLQAIFDDDLAEVADGICDSIVVLLGTAVTYGIDIRPVWDKVQEANMAKKSGPMREDGKRLKPQDWEHPDVESEIKRQQNVG